MEAAAGTTPAFSSLRTEPSIGPTRSGGLMSPKSPKPLLLHLDVKEKKDAFRNVCNDVEEVVSKIEGGRGRRGERWGGGGARREGSGERGGGLGAYYKRLLKADPDNPLLLRNYGKYLHEVEGDVEGAEKCFQRAVQASPDDGEVLSMCGKLKWEAHRDEKMAEEYFHKAIEVSPDDCHVLGSYARFLWDVDEQEEARSGNDIA